MFQQLAHVLMMTTSGHSQQAATYDTQHVELLNRLTVTFRDNLDFIGADWKSANGPDKTAGSAKLLDYACGTGMMTRVSLFPLHLARVFARQEAMRVKHRSPDDA